MLGYKCRRGVCYNLLVRAGRRPPQPSPARFNCGVSMPKNFGKRPADHPTSIRLPTSLKNALKDAAEEQRRSLSWLIVEILQQWESFNKTQKKHKAKA